VRFSKSRNVNDLFFKKANVKALHFSRRNMNALRFSKHNISAVCFCLQNSNMTELRFSKQNVNAVGLNLHKLIQIFHDLAMTSLGRPGQGLVSPGWTYCICPGIKTYAKTWVASLVVFFKMSHRRIIWRSFRAEDGELAVIK